VVDLLFEMDSVCCRLYFVVVVVTELRSFFYNGKDSIKVKKKNMK
jgi:hypothetical protein